MPDCGCSGIAVVAACDQENPLVDLRIELSRRRSGVTGHSTSVVGDSKGIGRIENAIWIFQSHSGRVLDGFHSEAWLLVHVDCGRLIKAMHGTRPAARVWQQEYTESLAAGCFVVGRASPSTFATQSGTFGILSAATTSLLQLNLPTPSGSNRPLSPTTV